jgi:hypothetical protein
MTTTRSRFCAICDSKYSFQCTCPNNKVMADQVNQSFHSGKRYKGKKAWNKVYLTDEELKNEKF